MVATHLTDLHCRGQVNGSGFEHGHDTPDVRRGFLRSGKLFILPCPDALHQLEELEAFQHPDPTYNTSTFKYLKLPQFITHLNQRFKKVTSWVKSQINLRECEEKAPPFRAGMNPTQYSTAVSGLNGSKYLYSSPIDSIIRLRSQADGTARAIRVGRPQLVGETTPSQKSQRSAHKPASYLRGIGIAQTPNRGILAL